MVRKIQFVLFALLLAASFERGLSQAVAQMPAVAPIPAPDQHDAIPLLTTSGPVSGTEQWETFAGGRIVRNVVAPTLTPVLPDPAKATGAAVIVAPGGAFMMLSMDSEGYQVAHWLADRGIAAFVLKYRVKPTARDPKVFLADLFKLMQAIPSGQHVDIGTPPDALEDGRAAVRMVRNRAAEWKIDPNRVGFLGFSAGAMLTLGMGLEPDHVIRPDFIGSIYGPMAAMNVPSDAPPMFSALAADDPLFGKSGFALISQWRQANRPVEFHYYEKGGHGFGMRHQGLTSDMWINEFYAWIKDRGLLSATAK
jgi:acetyl esterase/lipase